MNTATTEDRADEMLEMEESFYRMHLSQVDHYRVEESAAGKARRVRTKDGETREYESLTPPTGGVLRGMWRSPPSWIPGRIALSDGGFVERRLTDNAGQTELQRRIARCRQGSNSRRKLNAQLTRLRFRQKLANRNECHRAAENLPKLNMTRSALGTAEKPGSNVRAKSRLNCSILEQTWGIILHQLAYKADWYGGRIVRVDLKRTSQTCSECGTVNADHRRAKRYDCGTCGLRMDADTNAARNAPARGVGTSSPASARTAA